MRWYHLSLSFHCLPLPFLCPSTAFHRGSAKGKGLDEARLFPDGMLEVEAEPFCAAFRVRQQHIKDRQAFLL